MLLCNLPSPKLGSTTGEAWHAVKYLVKRESASLDTRTEFTEGKAGSCRLSFLCGHVGLKTPWLPRDTWVTSQERQGGVWVPPENLEIFTTSKQTFLSNRVNVRFETSSSLGRCSYQALSLSVFQKKKKNIHIYKTKP